MMDWDWDLDKDDDPRDAGRAFLTFEVGEAVFAVGVASVNEILDPQPLKPIPGAPPGILGMIDVRGRSIVAMEGADVFEVAGGDETQANRRLILFELETRANEASMRLLAVWVDRVRTVETFLDEEIDPAPDMAGAHVIASAKREGDTILFVEIDRSMTDLPGSMVRHTGVDLAAAMS